MHDKTITWCAAMMWLALAIFCLAGCFVRTIYVPDGKAVRLRQTIPNAKVWVLDANGKPVAGTMDIAAGWYALPMDDDDIPLGPFRDAEDGDHPAARRRNLP